MLAGVQETRGRECQSWACAMPSGTASASAPLSPNPPCSLSLGLSPSFSVSLALLRPCSMPSFP
eukprot:scaffold46851_cov33-Tisochrysis_lutea.AAC.6